MEPERQLPESVKRQIKAAEEAIARSKASAQGRSDPQEGQANAPEPIDSAGDEINIAATPTQNADTFESQESEMPNGDPAYWESRAKTLEGKYKAEVPRMAKEIRELKSELEEVKHRLSEKTTEFAQLKAQHYELQQELDVEEIQAAMQRSKSREAQVREELSKEELQRVREKERQAQFMSDLSSIVPNAREIDLMPEFATWLQGYMPGSTMTRAQYLGTSYRSGDVQATAKVFQHFIADTGAAQSTRPTSSNARLSDAPSIEDEIVPGQSQPTSVDARAPTGLADLMRIGRTWKATEIDRFWRDKRAPGHSSMLRGATPEQLAAIQRSIEWAAKNGAYINDKAY